MNYVACIAEGAAETAIIDILVDHHLLIFDREEILDEQVLRCRSASAFDSRREKFRLGKAYEHKVDVINVVTAPEIEMLIILNENRYDDFKKSGMKPSEYCVTVLKLQHVKSYDFVKQYFSDPSVLIAAMKKYTEVSRIPKGEWALLNLVK